MGGGWGLYSTIGLPWSLECKSSGWRILSPLEAFLWVVGCIVQRRAGVSVCGREYGNLRDERGILLSVPILVSVYLHVRISTGGFGSGGVPSS